VLGPECVVERLEQVDLLLLVGQQVLLAVAVAPAPQHVLVHLLGVAALVTYVLVLPFVHGIVGQRGWQEDV